MCLILHGSGGAWKESLNDVESHIQDIVETNPDGAGLMWLSRRGSLVRYEKAINGYNVLDLVHSKALGASYVAVHWRMTSVGGSDPRLTHPFPIGEDASLATEGKAPRCLMHNGHEVSWRDDLKRSALNRGEALPGEGEPWSDTRAVAYLAAMHGASMIETYASHSRWLMFSSVRGSCEFGEWQDSPFTGLRASNSQLRPRVTLAQAIETHAAWKKRMQEEQCSYPTHRMGKDGWERVS